MYQFAPPREYAVRGISGTEFLIRLICGIVMLASIGNAFAILTGRIDLVSWFTGFTIYDRDALSLFVAYAAAGVFFAAITFKWLTFLWWIALVLAASLFYAGYGVLYGVNQDNNEPGFMDTMKHKFSLENIKSLSGDTIPAAGQPAPAQSAPAQQNIKPVTQTVTQPVTETVTQNAAQKRAAAAHKKAVNIHTNRAKTNGYRWARELNPQEKKWCKNKAQRTAYKAKYDRATPAVRAKENLKPEWLVEARCVTGVMW